MWLSAKRVIGIQRHRSYSHRFLFQFRYQHETCTYSHFSSTANGIGEESQQQRDWNVSLAFNNNSIREFYAPFFFFAKAKNRFLLFSNENYFHRIDVITILCAHAVYGLYRESIRNQTWPIKPNAINMICCAHIRMLCVNWLNVNDPFDCPFIENEIATTMHDFDRNATTIRNYN